MSGEFAIGKALEIPKSVLDNITKIDDKIQDISKHSEDMSKNFKKAISSMGDNLKTLLGQLSKVDVITSSLGSIKVDNLSKGFGEAKTQAERMTSAVAASAAALNQFGNSGMNIAELTKAIKKVNKELRGGGGVSPMADQQYLVDYRKQLQDELKAQETSNQEKIAAYQKMLEQQSKADKRAYQSWLKLKDQEVREEKRAEEKKLKERERNIAAYQKMLEQQSKAQTRLDSRMRRSNYQSYITSTEGSLRTAERAGNYQQRAQAIKNIEAAMKKLRETDANYAQDLKRLTDAHKRLNEAQEKFALNLSQVASRQSHVMDISGQLTRKLALIFSVSQMTSYLVKLRDVTGEFELQNTALATILQNKNQADVLFQQITDLAVRSPFTVKELTTYTKSLSAYQVEYEKLYDTTKMLADVSSGLGVDMQRLILAFGQVKAANFLRGCLGYDTPIMLYNGSIKKVQDIVVGDILINEKGEPVNVLELIRGRETMFLVEQVSGDNRTSYRVNRNHILTLWNVQEQRLEDVYVYDYLKNKEAYLGLKIVNDEKVYYDIEVTKDRVDDYYGFVLDGNKRFRLGDGTVTHNTETRQFSEAGFNILGELAKYYSEIEGRIVSLGEVQDRQFKKMISFQDVEEVFRRVTSEGGIFYQMQERQAETIAGQVSNLKDSIDLMLNSIGTENREVIVTVISMIRSVAENWQVFASALKGAAAFMALYTIRTIAAAKANGAFTASALQATAAAGGLKGALATTMRVLQSMWNFAKKNPLILIASAAVTAGSIIYEHIQNVNKAKEQYDQLTKSLEDNSNAFNDLASRINKQNEAIRGFNDALESQKKGTDEYLKAQVELNRALSDQDTNLDELRNKYPEIYNEIVKNIDGTVNLTEAIRRYSQLIEDVKQINYYAEGTTSFFNDGFNQNIKDLSNAQNEYNKASEKGEAAIRDMAGELRKFIALNKEDIGTEKFTELSKRIDDIVKSEEDVTSRSEALNNIIRDFGQSWGFFSLNALKALHNVGGAHKDLEEAQRRLNNNIEDISENIREEFDLTSENGKQRAKEAAEVYLRQLKDCDEETRKFAAQKFTIHLGVQIDWSGKKEIEDVLYGDWRDVAVALDTTNVYKNSLKNVKDIQKFESMLASDYQKDSKALETINRALKAQSPLEKEIAKARAESLSANRQISQNGVKRLQQLKEQEKSYYNSLQVQKQSLENANRTRQNTAQQMNLNLQDQKTKNKIAKQERDAHKEALKNFKERLALMREVEQEYENLRGYMSKEEATEEVKRIFSDTNISAILKTMSGFEPKDMLKGYSMFVDEAKRIGKEATKALADEQRPIERKIIVSIEKENLERINKEIENVFSDYDLFKELSDLGLRSGTIQTVFGIDETSLKDVEDKISRYGQELIGQGEEYEKVWAEATKKVGELQDQEILERTKKYAKYLKEEYSEITRITLQLQEAISEVNKLNFSDAQKQTIIQNLKKEAQKNIDNQIWDDFKSSDFYEQMFDDISKIPTVSLDYLSSKLDELKGNLNSLDPTNLKEVIDAINKIKEEQISRNPLIAFDNGNIKEAIDFLKNRADLEKQLLNLEKERAALKERQSTQEQNVEIARVLYENNTTTFGKTSQQAEAARKNLENQEKILVDIGKRLEENNDKADKVNKQYEKGAKASHDIAMSLSDNAEKIGVALQSVQTLVDGLNSVFNMSEGFNDVVESLMGAGEHIKSAFSSASSAFEGFATGNLFQGITGSISAIGSIGSAIGSLFNIGDKKKEREIKKQLNIVKKLEKQYDKLKESIEGAYSIDELNESNKLAKENLEQQKDALEKAINAELDKKKTDKERVEELREQVEEVERQLQELEDERIASLGGFGSDKDVKSAAQAFADAWLDAYMETGDGLEALEDKWNDYIKNIVASQLMLKGTERFLKPIMDYVDGALNDSEFSPAEMDNLQSLIDQYMPKLNEYWKSIVGALGIKPTTDTDKLSNLQKGIEGITEETAQAIEAILESMRFYVVDTNTKLSSLMDIIIAAYENTINPMLTELRTQTAIIRSIDTTLLGVSRNIPAGGRALRVQIV